MNQIGVAFVVLGSALLVISALGLFRLGDALTRQHAATKSGTLAQGLILSGVALYEGGLEWWWRVALILVVLVMTLPVSAQMLARAAASRASEAPPPD